MYISKRLVFDSEYSFLNLVKLGVMLVHHSRQFSFPKSIDNSCLQEDLSSGLPSLQHIMGFLYFRHRDNSYSTRKLELPLRQPSEELFSSMTVLRRIFHEEIVDAICHVKGAPSQSGYIEWISRA